MKISNIILIAVVASATLIITTGALQMRFSGHENIEEKFETKNIEISEFKYLVVKDVTYPLNIVTGEKPAFELKTRNNNKAPSINYHHQGDTLIIQNLKWKDEYRDDLVISLKIPSGVNWVKANNASLHFRDYSNVELSLDLDRTRVSFNNNIQLKNLSLLAKNDSNVSANTGDLDTVSVEIDKSHITINGLVGKLKGSIKNNSTVSVRGINDFDFTKDNSSKLHHWN